MQKMKRIENIQDFIAWSKEVNLHTTYLLCDLQDIYARSNQDVLHNLFRDAIKNDKQLIIFAVNKAMGSEALLFLLHSYISYVANREIIEHIDAHNKDMSDEWTKIYTEQKAIDDGKQRIEQIEQENRLLKKNLASYQESNTSLYNEKIALKDELEALNKELNKQYSFESHIKKLLKAA